MLTIICLLRHRTPPPLTTMSPRPHLWNSTGSQYPPTQYDQLSVFHFVLTWYRVWFVLSLYLSNSIRLTAKYMKILDLHWLNAVSQVLMLFDNRNSMDFQHLWRSALMLFLLLLSSGTPWRNWRDCDDWRNTGWWWWWRHNQVWPGGGGGNGGDRCRLHHPQVHRDVTHGWAQATVQKPKEQASVIMHVHRLFGRGKLLRLEIRPPQRSTRGAISRIRSRPG